MKNVLFALAMLATVLTGCYKSDRDTSLYQYNGRAKPMIGVLPVINQTEEDQIADGITWDLSRELTLELRRKFFDSSRLYLLRESGNIEFAKKLNDADPQILAQMTLQNVGTAEFIIVTELVEQSEKPAPVARFYTENKMHSNGSSIVLAMDFRVRVLDVRGDHPKVILQELVHHDHFVPPAYQNCNYSKAPWGSEAFERTPLGIAHSRLLREVVARVESYVQTYR